MKFWTGAGLLLLAVTLGAQTLSQGWSGAVEFSAPRTANFRFEVHPARGEVPLVRVDQLTAGAWAPVADNGDPTGGAHEQFFADLDAAVRYRLVVDQPLAAAVSWSFQAVEFLPLKNRVQNSLASALAQSTPLKLRASVTLNTDAARVQTLVDSRGGIWSVVLAADRQSVRVWSLDQGKPLPSGVSTPGRRVSAAAAAFDLQDRLLLVLGFERASDGLQMYSWTGRAWAAEKLPDSGLTPPLAWSAGPRLWALGTSGTTTALRSFVWKSPDWAPAGGWPTGTLSDGRPWKFNHALELLSVGNQRFLWGEDESWGIWRQSGEPNTFSWSALTPPFEQTAQTRLGTLGAELAVLQPGSPLFLWNPTSGWRSADGAALAPGEISSQAGLLYVWQDDGHPRLLQFDGQDWRTPLPLDSLAPRGASPWSAQFVAPNPASKTGFLVLSRGAADSPGRVDVYDLP